MKPRFTHDCTNPGCCTFVGATNHHDVYVTRGGGLIMRWGDDGPEYSSMPTRGLAEMVALELHGAVYRQGGHTRGKGFEDDREKMNEGQLLGWLVIEASTGQLESGQALA